jgi:7-carboxy-7-deazaguanine synthase
MQITEIFHSIQGEGVLSGLPSIFIRTTGCNLRCNYCDTTFAYEGGKKMSIHQILSAITTYPCQNICITGGEPLIQKDTNRLITELLQKKYFVCLETNGSQPIDKIETKPSLMISMDVKTPSSNMHTHNRFENIQFLSEKDQLKCIIQNKKDYDYAKQIIKEYNPTCPIIFQPVWGFDPRKIASWILNDNIPVRLGLQLHKIIWGEKTQK